MSEVGNIINSKQDSLSFFGRSKTGLLHPEENFLYPGGTSINDTVEAYFSRVKANGRSTTLVDGAFDVPHPNHEAYLRHCRLLGAQMAVRALGATVTREKLSETVASDLIHMTVTVDADEKLFKKKSGRAEKGGVQRPIYPWTARADRVAGYCFELTGQPLKRTVDLVTVEGDSSHHGTALESSLTLARFLSERKLLDTFIIFGEHDATVRVAEEMDLAPVVIDSNETYFVNPQTQESYSSSAIINRAQGGRVDCPITKPSYREA